MRKFDLFILDWDGTLSTSTALVRLTHFLRLRYRSRYIKRHAHEFGADKNVVAEIPAEERISRLYASLYDAYCVFSKPRLREGVLPLLKTLKRCNKKIAIFSDSRQYRLLREAKMLNVSNYFKMIVSAETIGIYKPNPTGLELIVKRMHAEKKKSVYIGDMLSDVMTARFAGIASCAICGGLDPYSKLRSAEPDYMFESMEFLSKILPSPKRF